MEEAGPSEEGDGVREVEKTSVKVVRTGEGELGETEAEVMGVVRGDSKISGCMNRVKRRQQDSIEANDISTYAILGAVFSQ